jgi:hypothetical protein
LLRLVGSIPVIGSFEVVSADGHQGYPKYGESETSTNNPRNIDQVESNQTGSHERIVPDDLQREKKERRKGNAPQPPRDIMTKADYKDH